ncbi:hypothetical protein K1T71_009836 [Dendrolimus kikuchii]|uniref:Uncharacterized protein n=1 Tax=Dendrolimus kikuchii TaxID=765133 RepID=A0ACC1CSU2_9NEOP|nr:hypothetical protein K1T71_009836 [Dendrolimus kikuchii]
MYISVTVVLAVMVGCIKAHTQCVSTIPVCGNDGVTYRNICIFEETQQLDNELVPLYLGSCEEVTYTLRRSHGKKKTYEKGKKDRLRLWFFG